MSKSPINTFSLACPSGGDFYICQGNSTEFIGCCTSDPCADGSGSCPQADLEPATFNKLDYEGIVAQDCTDTTADWYTCSALSTPFMGCCKSNACTNTAGCPVADLVAAELGNATQAKNFLTTTATTASTHSSTATATTASSTSTSAAAVTTTTAAAASSSGTAAPVSDAATSGISTGAKAGIGVGAVALTAVIGLLFFVIKRTMRKRSGVVVRGSSPPTSPGSFSPARTYADPNQITFTPQISAPVRPPRPAKAPSTATYSMTSSPSTGFLSRETSVRSTATVPGSNASGSPYHHQYGAGSQQQHQYFGYAGSPMDTLAELDGSDAFPSPRPISPPISEMAASTPLSTTRPSLPPSPYRPYRPDR